MAFTSNLELEEGPLAKVSTTTRRGYWYKRMYSFAQGATDGGGTITLPSSATEISATGNGNVIDKALHFTVSTNVLTVGVDTTSGPTAGIVKVTYLLK